MVAKLAPFTPRLKVKIKIGSKITLSKAPIKIVNIAKIECP